MNLDPRGARWAREPRKENAGKILESFLSVFYDAHLIVEAMALKNTMVIVSKARTISSQCQHTALYGLIQKVMTTKLNSHVQLAQLLYVGNESTGQTVITSCLHLIEGKVQHKQVITNGSRKRKDTKRLYLCFSSMLHFHSKIQVQVSYLDLMKESLASFLAKQNSISEQNPPLPYHKQLRQTHLVTWNEWTTCQEGYITATWGATPQTGLN